VIVPGAVKSALADVLQPDEKVIWAGRPDPMATLRTQLFWWWLGIPVLVIALILHFGDVMSRDWSAAPVGIALALLAAPALMVAQAYGTIYAITDRRVIIRHDALGKRQVVDYTFGELDEALEILESGPEIGHLYFASGARSKVAYADYTGKVAFRELRKPEQVKALLEKVRKEAREK